MNELKEYKKVFLNHPRKTIKEMTELLKQSKKEEFLEAYMHNIYLLGYNLYNMFPIYFETHSIMDVISEGNELASKLYNKNIRDYKSFTFRIYYLFYIKTLHMIKINYIVKEKYEEIVNKTGKAPSIKELSKLTHFHGWEMEKETLDECNTQLNKIDELCNNDILDQISRNIKVRAINQTIKEMTDEEKILFARRYYDNESLRNIGKTYNKSHEWTRLEINKIKTKILTNYNKNNGEIYENK